MPKVKTDKAASEAKPEAKKKRARKAETGKRVVPDVSVRGPWSEGEQLRALCAILHLKGIMTLTEVERQTLERYTGRSKGSVNAFWYTTVKETVKAVGLELDALPAGPKKDEE
ncbi:hypothetical protein FA09DRAFT_340248 [Tilletiopsis washingtonensis]|uniref:Uncharacterized protein n=1 Tax=Tilletiopsis washingtonensis TaxID=58919 RepID=A0A316Z8F6_9BASI|nr:hypothetical protein FA09DRAFT_340248 [Tilletiopsis washingtonensis]PWN96453.1 hypothetical protein FA09DRAFT_340248 [Tilletiopsis washingtonensis]